MQFNLQKCVRSYLSCFCRNRQKIQFSQFLRCNGDEFLANVSFYGHSIFERITQPSYPFLILKIDCADFFDSLYQLQFLRFWSEIFLNVNFFSSFQNFHRHLNTPEDHVRDTRRLQYSTATQPRKTFRTCTTWTLKLHQNSLSHSSTFPSQHIHHRSRTPKTYLSTITHKSCSYTSTPHQIPTAPFTMQI